MIHDLEQQSFGATTVLYGAKRGKYPQGNSLVVRGSEETAIIDPSLGLLARGSKLPAVDRILNSHCHEDHIAGNHLFPAASVHLHEADLPGIQSLDGVMAIYGFTGAIEEHWRKAIVEQFHFEPRPDALSMRDGDVFELGGGVRIRVIHAPGHTRGHCVLHVEPDDLLYLADIDLSSFGPYYGDAWSSLADFEETLREVRAMEARYYATFHHVGVIDERDFFLQKLDAFTEVITMRENRMLEFLREPHSLEEIVAHRFVYRPEAEISFADGVERRSMGQHVERLLAAGRLRNVGAGQYLAAG